MIENFLLQIGMRCGTVKNFNTTIVDDLRKSNGARWYFLTPIKATSNVGGLKTATIQLAFPFQATREDISEEAAIKRIETFIDGYESTLLSNLRKMLIVPDFTIAIIPFWANESGESRTERKNFGQNSIHIINAKATVKYRDAWFNCNC